MAWSLTVDGQVFREGDLTIDEAERMEQVCAVTWRQLNPLRSAAIARGIAQVLCETRLGMTAEAAKAKVGSLRVDDYFDMVGSYDPDEDMPDQYENGFPPPAAEISIPG